MATRFSPNISRVVGEFLRASDMLLNPAPNTPKFTFVELDLIRAYVDRLVVAFPVAA
jgi:hypothetical protein